MNIFKKVLAIFFAASIALPTAEVPEAEPFSQEQIEMFESMVWVPKEVKPEPPIILLDTIPLEGKYQIYAQELCYEYRISYSLVLAVMESESSFIWQEGDSGKSIGWMQIRKCNWDKYELDAHDPYDNLEIGIRMLAELKDKYQSFDKIIMAYKGGETAMLKWVEEGYTLPCCETLASRQSDWGVELDRTRVY